MEQRLRGLVVEDDDATRTLFRQSFGDEDIEVLCVSHDGLPATASFAFVLTDLPGGLVYSSDGAIAWVSMLRERYNAPVVVLTGRPEAESDEILRRAATVLIKPPELSELIAHVRRVRTTRATS